MASSTMQLPTVTSRGAERRLKRQRHTQGGRRLDSGGSDGEEHTTEPEQHDAAVHRDEPRSREAPEDAARHKSGRSIDSGDGDGVVHAAELEQHDAAAHRDEPRSVKVAEEAAGLAERPAPRQRQKPLR